MCSLVLSFVSLLLLLSLLLLSSLSLIIVVVVVEVVVEVVVVVHIHALSAGWRAAPGTSRGIRKGPTVKSLNRAVTFIKRGLKHNEAYRTPIFCTVRFPKVPLVPSNLSGFQVTQK